MTSPLTNNPQNEKDFSKNHSNFTVFPYICNLYYSNSLNPCLNPMFRAEFRKNRILLERM